MNISKRRTLLLTFCIIALCSLLVIPLLLHSAPDVTPNITKAIDFLEGSREPYALLFLNIIYRRFGIEEFSNALQRYDQVLAEDPNDEPRLRLLRRIADYDNPLQNEDMDAVTDKHDLLTIPALYCDRQELPSDYIYLIYGAVDSGGYLLTHALLALIWIQENGCELTLPDGFIETAYKSNAELIDNDHEVYDIELEAAAFLYLAGQGKLVDSTFVERVIEAQNVDGSWGQSSDKWHSTVLGLLFLLHLEFPADSYPPSLAPASS